VDRAVQVYHQALALRKLGDPARAELALRELLAGAEAALARAPREVDYFSSYGRRPSERSHVADAHYLVGLCHLGLGAVSQARAAFDAALVASPDHLGARLALDGMMP
jgi:tetratricopeptide (TPR) repeat protein